MRRRAGGILAAAAVLASGGCSSSSHPTVAAAAPTDTFLAGTNPATGTSSSSTLRGTSATSSSPGNAKAGRMHPIRRLYGEDNASVRRELNKIETESTDYWRTGIKGDPDHVVRYKNHPYAKNRDGSHGDDATKTTPATRRLQEEDDGDSDSIFKPMRIRFDTSALESQRTATNGAQIDFIENEILPRMGRFWSETLSVVPVEDKLILSTAELANRRYCGDSEFTEVPAEHL